MKNNVIEVKSKSNDVKLLIEYLVYMKQQIDDLEERLSVLEKHFGFAPKNKRNKRGGKGNERNSRRFNFYRRIGNCIYRTKIMWSHYLAMDLGFKSNLDYLCSCNCNRYNYVYTLCLKAAE